MRPLAFLLTRSAINMVRRALTSGKRLITILFAFLYYGWLVVRPIGAGTEANIRFNPVFVASPRVIDAVVFGAFALMALLLTLTVSAPRGGFGPADVDVLFATPVNPRAVMFFRMMRDYVATLISPFLLALFGGRFSYLFARMFFGGMKQHGMLAIRAGLVAWFLMALAWICVGYGVGLTINRSDLAADRNKKIVDTILILFAAGTVLYAVYFFQNPSADSAIRVAQSPVTRVLFFTATAACWMVVGALQGQWLFATLGFVILAGLTVFGISLSLSQLPMLYDQAAVKGFGSSERRALRRSNDLYGLSAHRAREGKVKAGWLSRIIARIRWRGAPALLWKEMLLQVRSSSLMTVFVGVMLILMIVPILSLDSSGRKDLSVLAGTSILLIQGLGVLMLTMNSAISGFTELLKRVDFQKPLPFTPEGTVIWEVSSKCIPNITLAGLTNIVVIAERPDLWNYAIASEFLVIGLSMIVSATVFLVTVAFPDAGDPSQRGFRGLLILLGSVIFSSPGIGTIILLQWFLKLSPLWSVVPATAINLGAALVVCFLSGRLYDGFNPSE